MKQNQNLQIKLAQLNMAMRHVLRTRQMQKQSSIFGLGGSKKELNKEDERYKEIGDLLRKRDRSLIRDILGGAGKGSLWGLGIGGLGGATLASIPGADFGRDAELVIDGPLVKPLVTGAVSSLGGVLGGLGAMPLGATIGGLSRLVTHNSRKQKAINRLKELGIESNE